MSVIPTVQTVSLPSDLNSASNAVAASHKRASRKTPIILASKKKYVPKKTVGVVCNFAKSSHNFTYDKRKKQDYQVPLEKRTKINRMYQLNPASLVVPPEQDLTEERLLQILMSQFQALDTYLPDWPSKLSANMRNAYYDIQKVRSGLPDPDLDDVPNQQCCLVALRTLHSSMTDLVESLPQVASNPMVIILLFDLFYRSCYVIESILLF